MKKLLLTLTAFVAVLTASADEAKGWNASFEPVSDSTELKGVHVATADGAVYVSTTYNKAFTFAGKEIADPEGLTSSAIVKYDAAGKELWAVSMEGNAVVYALDADTDGTLYAAGNFMDVVKYTGADGAKAELVGSAEAYTAFIARISADGKFQQVKTLASTANAEVSASMMYFPMAGDVYVTPKKILIDGDKVYVSANYTGDVAELAWKGSYINVFDFMYMDNRNVGLFAMNKVDFSGAKSIATVQNTEIVSYNQHYPEAFDFTVDNGTVYAGFIGFGNLTMQAADSANNFNFNVATDETGNKEHAFVLATISDNVTTKVYNAANHDKDAKPYNLFMNVAGENLIIGGTFYGELPFDTQKTTGELASDLFTASVKKADGTVNNTFVAGKEIEATSMSVTGDKANVTSTAAELYQVDLTAGTATTVATQQAILCADAATTVYAEKTKVCINSTVEAIAGIQQVIRPTVQADGLIYNLAGQPVGDNYKGIVIRNGKKYMVK